MIKSIITLISDYCGVVNESSVRTNFALIYELIDEAIGNVIRGELNGRIKIKSFLNKTTQVEIGFTPIIVGKDNSKFQYQKGITIDDCNFHANCDKTRFERQHIVSLFPPKGEFDLMNYRMSSPNLDAPFRIIPKIDNIKKSFISLKIKVQSNFSEFISARNVLIYFNVPDEVINIPHDFSTGMEQKLFFEKQKRKVTWKINKFFGQSEQVLDCSLILQKQLSNIKKIKNQIGDICMEFEIPFYSSSNIQIKTLNTIQTLEKKKKKKTPIKYIRYVSVSKSYFQKL
ncbi:ap-4 complex subunit mu-1 [Anaeramoeba flamelloides]|uniref:Ap-4 complex subunit mu-1 n=1 Tax=Anaeramoeba flamelloides TaxID=1746091 RepID=A0ABQ8XMQ9_9EUKA|nr:ap-4 complex subunit mu-1 [Anaeramoeba flamelloides]